MGAMSAPGTLHCRNCGTQIPPPYTTCPSCGSAPYTGTSFCYGCGAPSAPNVLSCSNCGTQLGAPAAAPAGSGAQGKATAINILTLAGGILGIMGALGIMIGTFFLYIPWIYGLTMGIITTVKGAKLIGANSRYEEPPRTTAIMQIINIINCDLINCAAGIIILTFLNDPGVRAYYRQPYPAQPYLPPQA